MKKAVLLLILLGFILSTQADSERQVIFTTSGEFEYWNGSRSEPKCDEMEKNCRKTIELPAAPDDGTIWVVNDNDYLWPAQAICYFYIKKEDGNWKESSGNNVHVKKGTEMKIVMKQSTTYSISFARFDSARYHVKVYFKPDKDKAAAGARITYLKGTAWIKTKDGKTIKAQNGATVAIGSEIRSGDGCILEVLLPGGHLVRMKPKTTLIIPKAKENSQKSIGFLQMLFGKIWCRAERGFKIKTPAAVAGVRATEFEVEHQKGCTVVRVIKGSVWVKPIKGGKETVVKAGKTFRVGGKTSSDKPSLFKGIIDKIEEIEKKVLK
ncbi:MAG TPA: hypothetical protein ENI34_04360 [candidate division WOR-3 bacterium]|uniref:FecR protein domain-containing protein n=1 Tax=candidate division WOR-3 bacterium TaxID=2052148 RepID=A0A9C9EM87_UNCW3|nr:hypothetical protein [candidate division WOR-3 bacterium]